MDFVMVSADLLSRIFDHAGMSTFLPASAVCQVWKAAAASKLEQWRVLRYSTTIGDKGCFSGPDSVNTLPNGTLCVADTCNNRLQVIRQSGQVLRTVNFERPLGELKFHTGLAADEDAFYVVDNANHALKKLRLADGEHPSRATLDTCAPPQRRLCTFAVV